MYVARDCVARVDEKYRENHGINGNTVFIYSVVFIIIMITLFATQERVKRIKFIYFQIDSFIRICTKGVCLVQAASPALVSQDVAVCRQSV